VCVFNIGLHSICWRESIQITRCRLLTDHRPLGLDTAKSGSAIVLRTNLVEAQAESEAEAEVRVLEATAGDLESEKTLYNYHTEHAFYLTYILISINVYLIYQITEIVSDKMNTFGNVI